VAGVLLGQAVGDAIGAPYEFRTPPAYGQARFGRGTFGHAPGQATDDTEQAICVAAAKSDPLKVAANLLRWYSDPAIRDIGSQTRSVMSHARTPRGLAQASRAYSRRQAMVPKPRGFDPHGSGNGGLMRTGPVCLPYLGDRKRIAVAARRICSLTHADVWDGDSAVIWSLAISDAIEQGEAWSAEMISDGLQYLPPERAAYWEEQIDLALCKPPRTFWRNGGSVGCFRAALSSVSHAESLPDGLYIACSIGNDSDTVSAVTGALLGSIFGASAVPDKWRRRVWGWPSMDADSLERLALQAAGVAESAQLTR
jgi:ADP-ribosylglycohydrolase